MEYAIVIITIAVFSLFGLILEGKNKRIKFLESVLKVKEQESKVLNGAIEKIRNERKVKK